MGILSFVAGLRQHEDALAEIEARKQAEIAVEQARQDSALRSENIKSVFTQKELFNSLRDTAIAEGNTPEEAERIAHQQYVQYLASSPLLTTAQNRSQLHQLKGSEPFDETIGATGAQNEIGRNIAGISTSALNAGLNRGRIPLAPQAGENEYQANIVANKASKAENINRRNSAMATEFSAPQAAVARTEQDIANAKLGTDTAGILREFVPKVIPAQQTQAISEATLGKQQADYTGKVLQDTDPKLAAQAANTFAKEKIATSAVGAENANLTALQPLAQVLQAVSSMGGMQMMNNNPAIASNLTQRITSALQPPTAPADTNAVPSRKLLNLKQLKSANTNATAIQRALSPYANVGR